MSQLRVRQQYLALDNYGITRVGIRGVFLHEELTHFKTAARISHSSSLAVICRYWNTHQSGFGKYPPSGCTQRSAAQRTASYTPLARIGT